MNMTAHDSESGHGADDKESQSLSMWTWVPPPVVRPDASVVKYRYHGLAATRYRRFLSRSIWLSYFNRIENENTKVRLNNSFSASRGIGPTKYGVTNPIARPLPVTVSTMESTPGTNVATRENLPNDGRSAVPGSDTASDIDIATTDNITLTIISTTPNLTDHNSSAHPALAPNPLVLLLPLEGFKARAESFLNKHAYETPSQSREYLRDTMYVILGQHDKWVDKHLKELVGLSAEEWKEILGEAGLNPGAGEFLVGHLMEMAEWRWFGPLFGSRYLHRRRG